METSQSTTSQGEDSDNGSTAGSSSENEEDPQTAPFGLSLDQYDALLENDQALHRIAPLFLTSQPHIGHLLSTDLHEEPWLGPKKSRMKAVKVSSEPVYAIVDMAEKGKGVVATRDFVAGEIVLAETPLLIIDDNDLPVLARYDYLFIEERLSELSEEDRQAYYSLSSDGASRNRHPIAKIWYTNTYGVKKGTGAVFSIASRSNHSCVANVANAWVEEEGKQYFFTCRDVRKGEELFTSYTGWYRLRHERERHLSESYCFKCKCQICSLAPAESEQDDQARTELRQISDLLDTVIPHKDLPLKFHGICCRGLKLLRDYNIHSFLEIELAHAAYMVSILFGYRPIADIWIDELIRLSERHGIIGKSRIDRYRFYEVMKEDPECHPVWGVCSEGDEEEGAEDEKEERERTEAVETGKVEDIEH
ncbi:hypothetical protein JCM3765_001961 [Sporobolomyces pararoseus]